MSKSRIHEAVHETACDLERLGFIDRRRMARYDTLCGPSLPEYDASRIKALRERYRISQAVLATFLNTSVSAVRQWETGSKHPSGPSQKLLNLLDRKGLEVLV